MAGWTFISAWAVVGLLSLYWLKTMYTVLRGSRSWFVLLLMFFTLPFLAQLSYGILAIHYDLEYNLYLNPRWVIYMWFSATIPLQGWIFS